MEDLSVCRFCLATEHKLFKLSFKQESAYGKLTGSALSVSSVLPRYVCTYCSALLVKCAAFKQRCLDTQNILDTYVLLASKLTPEDIDILQKENNTTLPYQVTACKPPIKIIYCEPEVKQEYSDDNTTTYDESPFIFTNDDDDDEPLSKQANKNKLLLIKNENDIFDFDNDIDSDVKRKRKRTVKERDKNNDEDFTVIELSKEEQLAEIEARKTSSNYLNCLYKCDLCYKGFVTENTYKNHMIKHDPVSGEYSCDICRVRFTERRALRNHSLVTHERQYVCKRCGHADKSAHKASVHSRWHNGHVYTCESCGASFSKPTTYLTHVRSAHRSAHECVSCGETFLSRVGLSMHMKKSHSYAQEASTKEYICADCSTQFRNEAALNKHKDYCSNDRETTSSCLECGEHFETEELLAQHLQTHRKNYNCQLCGKSFSSARCLGRHACPARHSDVTAPGRNPGMTASNPRAEQYICHVCGATLSSKNSWTYHLRIHTGEKPFSCSYCSKTFSVHQRLKIHVRGHTGERPLQCARCPKAFRHRAALARHERVHTGVKPYRCPRCHKCFSQSNSCKLHLRTVHMRRQEYPYTKSKENVDKE